MPKFIATASKGLGDALLKEIQDMGIPSAVKVSAGVEFEGNWATCYKVNLRSRIASRVLLTILDFPAYNADEVYHNMMKHDFTKYIDPDQLMMVEATVRESAIRDQRFLAMRVKDAIVDQFRTKFDVRPSVDSQKASLRVYIRGVKDFYNVSIDTSGDSLFKRGYRSEQGEAPIKENVAAALIALSEWDQKSVLVDPFCGSGTLLIEAALMKYRICPGTLRKRFVFQSLKNYQEEAFEAELDECLSQEIEMDSDKQEFGDAQSTKSENPSVESLSPSKTATFFGYDIDGEAIKIAKRNAVRAGVGDEIEFKRQPVETLTAPAETGMIVTNPPYGARLGDEALLVDLYKDFAHTMKVNFKGWTAWVLSGNKDLTPHLKLKSLKRVPLWNGPLECRFLKYNMF